MCTQFLHIAPVVHLGFNNIIFLPWPISVNIKEGSKPVRYPKNMKNVADYIMLSQRNKLHYNKHLKATLHDGIFLETYTTNRLLGDANYGRMLY